MTTLTTVQKQILWAVIERDGLPVQSLFQLSSELGIDYSWAWACLRALERAGLIEIDRPSGRDLFISLRSANGYWKYRGFSSAAGPAFINPEFIKQKAKTGAAMVDPISSLRASLPRDDNSLTEYPRPELTQEEQDRYSRSAVKINKIKAELLRLQYVAALVYENVRLLRECNEHRAARGLAPLPVYDPEGKHGR